MKATKRYRIVSAALVQLLAIGGLVLASQGVANAAPWTNGDVFVAISDGKYQQFTSTGGTLDLLQAGVAGHTYVHSEFGVLPSGGLTGQCAFNPTAGIPGAPQNLYTTLWSENKIAVVDDTHVGATHPVLATIDTTLSGGTGHPESIAFDSAGNFYVGLVDGTGPNLLKYNRNHVLQATYTLAVGNRGVDSISLAADQETIYYTSEDSVIRRFDVGATPGQLSPFPATGLSTAYGIRVLQGTNPFGAGGASGFLMVADYKFDPVTKVETGEIKVFNANGTFARSYDRAGHDGWFAMSIKEGGSTFVATDFRNGNVVTFNSDGTSATPFNASSQPFQVNGACVRGEVTPGVVPFPEIGFFIIGDTADGVPDIGSTVYFWGNNWAVNNPMTGVNNGNMASFKGFAETTNPTTPFCGTTPPIAWTSGGGASSEPPETLPPFVAVIVTNTISKTGSIKAQGPLKAILLVQVNQGTYDNSSGGVGTGTVFQVICS